MIVCKRPHKNLPWKWLAFGLIHNVLVFENTLASPFLNRYKSNEDYVYVRGRGRGKYICEECGIRCKKPSMLKKHIRTHTDVRPYVCKLCNFAFKTKGTGLIIFLIGKTLFFMATLNSEYHFITNFRWQSDGFVCENMTRQNVFSPLCKGSKDAHETVRLPLWLK